MRRPRQGATCSRLASDDAQPASAAEAERWRDVGALLGRIAPEVFRSALRAFEHSAMAILDAHRERLR